VRLVRSEDVRAEQSVRAYAVVANSFNRTTGISGIGIVLHETSQPRRRGPIVERFGEAYSDVPARDTVAFSVLRALEIVGDRGVWVLKIGGPFSKGLRGPVCSSSAAVLPQRSHLWRRVVELGASFEIARIQFIPRRRTLNARLLARAALSDAVPRLRPDLFPDGPIGCYAGAAGDGPEGFNFEDAACRDVDNLMEALDDFDDIPF
jgi:hypothetical protein